MARVLPFRALLTSPTVSAPRPWDAQGPLSEAERRQLLAEETHGLHLVGAPDSRAALARWLERGVLRREERPAFYVFEVQSPQLAEPPARFVLGMIPPQEGLEPLEQGRRPTDAPLITPQVAVAADDHRALHELLAGVAAEDAVLLEGRLDDDRRWRLLREDRAGPVRRLQALLEDAPLRPLGPLPEGSAQLTAVLPLSEPGWRFRSIHRAVKGLENFDADRFLQLVAGYARVLPLDARLDTELGRAEARERLGTVSRGSHAVLLVLPGGRTHLLRFRQGIGLPQIPAVPRSPTLRSLDLALLNSLVLRTVLGLRDPEEVGHANVFTVPNIEALVRGVNDGLYQVGFALNPPPAWEVRAVMEAGESLPPRTLRLEPWPPAGLLYGDPS